MKLNGDAGTHLTYCTNVHAGDALSDVQEHLRTHVASVKAAVSPDHPMGVGLRLSAEAASELNTPSALETFRQLLDDTQLYVFTLNGFPYGRFHGAPVKAAVYEPDWRSPARLAYSNTLALCLQALLPEGCAGSISTVPGCFRPEAKRQGSRELIARQLVEHAAFLWNLKETSGKELTLALEPEPSCLLETSDEAAAFFRDYLLSAAARKQFTAFTRLNETQAEQHLRTHLGVCLDACHAAVEFENASASIAELRSAGIRIAKLQLSSGLRIPSVGHSERRALAAFNDDVYLHQVVARRGSELIRFLDLPDALALPPAPQEEWRVHFHVPIFLKELEVFSTTQDFLAELLALHRQEPLTQHLEVETYTWDVLPRRYRQTSLAAAIARELLWVKERLST